MALQPISHGPRPLILITNPIHEEVQRRLSEFAELDMNPATEPWPQTEIMRRAFNASAMMGFMTDQVDADFIKAAPQMKIVACALKGFDNYDVAACTAAGVWVSIVPDLLTEPTAELAVGLAIALGRHVRAGDAHIRSGEFSGWRSHFYGVGLHGSTVAVIGCGLVGRAIIQRLKGFGCHKILCVDPNPQAQISATIPCALEQALQASDYVIVAAPLTGTTHRMIGSEQLAHSKPGQLIINIGRGSVVDEAAVATALARGQVGGYAADVFACEDWRLLDRPIGISSALINHPNTIFTPHIGSAVSEVRIAIEQRAASNIIAVLSGLVPSDAINQP
jgi:phosphonate dehydrogenase